MKNLINKGEFSPPALIFVQSKERADELLNEIKKLQLIKIDSIHSSKSQKERLQIFDDFR